MLTRELTHMIEMATTFILYHLVSNSGKKLLDLNYLSPMSMFG